MLAMLMNLGFAGGRDTTYDVTLRARFTSTITVRCKFT
jgi:hypothetical protein